MSEEFSLDTRVGRIEGRIESGFGTLATEMRDLRTDVRTLLDRDARRTGAETQEVETANRVRLASVTRATWLNGIIAAVVSVAINGAYDWWHR